MRVDCVDVELSERELAERVNDLLSRWHAWCAGHSYASGFSSVNAACRMARASRQYDDTNGSLDAQIDVSLMEAVDAQLNEIAQPWRAALDVLARNLHTGVSVWSNPRLPLDDRARAELVYVARKKFVERLARAGLL